MPKHTKFTNNPLTGQLEKTTTEATTSISIGIGQSTPPSERSTTTSHRGGNHNRRGGSPRGGRVATHQYTDRLSFNDGKNRKIDDNAMIDENDDQKQTRPSWGKRRVSTSQTNMSLAENEFSSALFSIKVGLKENVVMSPFSIFICFLNCMVGTNNESLTEIIDGLFLSKSYDSVGNFNTLKEKFENWKKTELEKYTNMIKILIQTNDTLSIANRIYLQETVQIKEPFLQELESKFDSQAERVDFMNKPSAQVRLINKWVEDKTRKYIRDLLSDTDINRQTIMVLVNAIYFNGKWKYQFKNRSTFKKSFRTISNPSGGDKCDMMHMSSDKKFCYANLDEYQLLQLPYSDEDYCMTFIKPNENVTLNEETENDFNQWIIEKLQDITQLQPNTFVKVDRIEIPKFKFQATLPNLVQSFSEDPFNIKNIFSSQADFSSMLANSNDQVHISNVIHKAFIQVDESGTVAAAATAMGGRGGGRVMKKFTPSYQFIADRPFVFILQHLPTNTILFTGKINEMTN